MFENKILTWDTLVKRGEIRLGRCVHCLSKEETIDHLMVERTLAQKVWLGIRNDPNITLGWLSQLMVHYFSYWKRVVEHWKELPYFIYWEILEHQNFVIFEGLHIFVQRQS